MRDECEPVSSPRTDQKIHNSHVLTMRRLRSRLKIKRPNARAACEAMMVAATTKAKQTIKLVSHSPNKLNYTHHISHHYHHDGTSTAMKTRTSSPIRTQSTTATQEGCPAACIDSNPLHEKRRGIFQQLFHAEDVWKQ